MLCLELCYTCIEKARPLASHASSSLSYAASPWTCLHLIVLAECSLCHLCVTVLEQDPNRVLGPSDFKVEDNGVLYNMSEKEFRRMRR